MQRADQNGNAHLWGIIGEQKEAAFAAKKGLILHFDPNVSNSFVLRPNTVRRALLYSFHDDSLVTPELVQEYYERLRVEGYTESTATGLMAGLNLDRLEQLNAHRTLAKTEYKGLSRLRRGMGIAPLLRGLLLFLEAHAPVRVAAEPQPAAVTAESAAAVAPAPEAQAATPEREVSASAAPEAPQAEDEFTEEDLADARDPASFVSFLMSIASNAASALGMMEHPVTHQRDVDVELGKHWIDVLGMLQKKTAGNLTPQEKRMLEGLLADLRMQYVSLINSPQQARFSGSDITGGR